MQGSVTLDKSCASLSGEGEGPQLLQGAFDPQAFGALRRLRLIVDGSSIEVFINDAATFAVRSYPSLPGSTLVRIAQAGNPAATADVSLWPLRLPPGGGQPMPPVGAETRQAKPQGQPPRPPSGSGPGSPKND